MSGGGNEDQPVLFRLPDQQPVRLDVALPVLGPVSPQLVRSMSRIEWLAREQLINDRSQLLGIFTTPFGASQVFIELLAKDRPQNVGLLVLRFATLISGVLFHKLIYVVVFD